MSGIYLLDRQTGQSRIVTEIIERTEGIRGHFAPTISANGCVLAFVTFSLDDVLDDPVEQVDVYVYDCEKAELEAVCRFPLRFLEINHDAT